VLQVTVNNLIILGMFLTAFFVYFNAYFACFLSIGSAKAGIWRGDKLNGHLMASCVRNNYTKNYENLIIFVHVKIEKVLDVFETRCRKHYTRKAQCGECATFTFYKYVHLTKRRLQMTNGIGNKNRAK